MKAAGGLPSSSPPQHPQPSIYQQVVADLGFDPENPPMAEDEAQ